MLYVQFGKTRFAKNVPKDHISAMEFVLKLMMIARHGIIIMGNV